jgi:hypothetical protein
MSQKIEELSSADITRIEAQRKWVREHYPPEAEHNYQKLSGKLALINKILENNWIGPEETLKLQCLGVTFGDALVQQESSLSWVAVEDEYGRDPALNFQGTSILMFPLTMISKRIENGEKVDVYTLFGQTLKKLEELKLQAD